MATKKKQTVAPEDLKGIPEPEATKDITIQDLIAGVAAKDKKKLAVDTGGEEPLDKEALKDQEERVNKVLELATKKHSAERKVELYQEAIEIVRQTFAETISETTKKLLEAEERIRVLEEDNESLRKGIAPSKGQNPGDLVNNLKAAMEAIRPLIKA
jgi:hypothetical protein